MIINKYKANTLRPDTIICRILGKPSQGNFSFWFDRRESKIVKKHRWSMNKRRYVYCLCHGFLLHRLIIKAKDGEIVDHIDRRPENNSIANLRLVTHAENMRNSKVSESRLDNIPVKGVAWTGFSWRVDIIKNGSKFSHSGFDTLNEAICFRIRQEYELWGDKSINYRPLLKKMPRHLLKIYFPEIYGKNNYKYIGSPIFNAHYKRDYKKNWYTHSAGVRKAGVPM